MAVPVFALGPETFLPRRRLCTLQGSKMRSTLSFLAVGLLVSVAIGQGRPPSKVPAQKKSPFPPGLTPPIVPRARLLMFPEIQKELGVSAAMAKKIKAEYDKPMSPKDKPLPFDQMKVKWLAKERGIVAMLSGAQQKRLTELTYQCVGILGVRSVQAAKALGLTKEQDKKLVTNWAIIYSEARKEAQKHKPPQISKTDPLRKQKTQKALDEHDAIYDKYHARAKAYAMTVLTGVQKTKWAGMQGKPFAWTRAMKR